MTKNRAERIREIIEAAAQSLSDATALEVITLHPEWKSGTEYTVGFKVQHGGVLYRCLTAHTAQGEWTPDVSHSLWAKVLVEDGKILPWEQPDSTNAYMTGDKVSHNDKIWISNVDNNVWEPGVYGWYEIVE